MIENYMPPEVTQALDDARAASLVTQSPNAEDTLMPTQSETSK